MQPDPSIVVFSPTEPSGTFVPHLVFKWDSGNSYPFPDLVIAKVPPGQYEEYEEESDKPRKVSIDLEGLFYEALEKAASLYHWKMGVIFVPIAYSLKLFNLFSVLWPLCPLGTRLSRDARPLHRNAKLDRNCLAAAFRASGAAVETFLRKRLQLGERGQISSRQTHPLDGLVHRARLSSPRPDGTGRQAKRHAPARKSGSSRNLASLVRPQLLTLNTCYDSRVIRWRIVARIFSMESLWRHSFLAIAGPAAGLS